MDNQNTGKLAEMEKELRDRALDDHNLAIQTGANVLFLVWRLDHMEPRVAALEKKQGEGGNAVNPLLAKAIVIALIILASVLGVGQYLSISGIAETKKNLDVLWSIIP